MITFLVDEEGNTLHPTNKSDMIRRWLKQGKAKVLKGGLRKGEPLLVQVSKKFNKSKTVDAEFRIGIDPGYKNIGFSVHKIYKNKITKLFSGEVETRTSEVTKNLKERKMYRQTRRHNRRKNVQRKFVTCKFRKPIWKNRKKHKFQPTHIHLINSHINILKFILDRVPANQGKVHIEYNKFDMQKILNPNIQNWQYQKGLQYNFENTKAYIRARDNYTCQICNIDVSQVPNEVHHIIEKSQGGSNRPGNLILLCQKCHAKVHQGLITCPIPNNNFNFRDTGVLNSCMKEIYKRIEKHLPVQWTYGYITKTIRLAYDIPKTHANDASVIAFCDNTGLQDIRNYKWEDFGIVLNFKQYRRRVRNWVIRYEDRKYYLEGYCEAWNRKRRAGQDLNKISLVELKRELRIEKSKLNVVAKAGGPKYRRSNTKIKFRPGDIIKVIGKGYDTCRGWASTHSIVLGEKFPKIKIRQCQKILNNSGLVQVH